MLPRRLGFLIMGFLTVCSAACSAATYLDEECGFRFAYSNIWALRREPISDERNSCGYVLVFIRKTVKGARLQHRVNIFLSDYEFKGFDQEKAWFQQHAKWYEDRGMAGTGAAYPIRGMNWVGMSCPDGPARCYGAHGYEGAGWSPTATLFSAVLKRRANLDGGECAQGDKQGLELMLPTFEFLDPLMRR